MGPVQTPRFGTLGRDTFRGPAYYDFDFALIKSTPIGHRHRLIEMFGGLHSVRDKGAVEAAVFRPQTGYYNSMEEEAAALMESLGNNHGFLDDNKRIAFTATDVFLRRNGFYIEVEGLDGHAFIDGSMDRHEFRFPQILDWIRQHVKSLV